ncbi:F-box protein [Tripterygium wilfordii]|uniref:F-box protein n=1 Tax=Tripterygium wilfordii TaxID=458696 RepID=A0A7J7C8B6_TRIWF|nr:F-box protein [Tripterygium wilfordii]
MAKVSFFMGYRKMGKLDNDVAFDVLSRLQTKDLLCLKRVSKDWHHIMSDPSFIEVQSRRKEPLMGFFFQQRFKWCFDDIKTITYIPLYRKATQLHQNVFSFLPQQVVVLATCNGLVCCRSCYPFEDPKVYVCNPLNKQWIEIEWPKPDKACGIALAFDPFRDLKELSTNFKLVRVEQLANDMEELYFSFEIYSSKTRTWKLSKEICWCNCSLFKNNGVFIGDVLHWLTDGDEILTYNVESELSWLIPVAVPASEFTSVPEGCIGESEGRLHHVMVSDAGLHVWVLDDYFEFKWSLKHSKTIEAMEEEHPKYFCNLRERVTQRLTVDASPWVDPLAFKDGVLLMMVSTKTYWYHYETCKMEEICDISKFGTNSTYCPMVFPYVMSLASLDTK